MTKEEYNSKIKELQDDFEKKKSDVEVQYAMSNNPYNVGDILQSDFGIILKVEKVRVARKWSDMLPECVYIGQQLTKKLEPHKRPDVRQLYQSSIAKKL